MTAASPRLGFLLPKKICLKGFSYKFKTPRLLYTPNLSYYLNKKDHSVDNLFKNSMAEPEPHNFGGA
jgi:hypothetical protein